MASWVLQGFLGFRDSGMEAQVFRVQGCRLVGLGVRRMWLCPEFHALFP